MFLSLFVFYFISFPQLYFKKKKNMCLDCHCGCLSSEGAPSLYREPPFYTIHHTCHMPTYRNRKPCREWLRSRRASIKYSVYHPFLSWHPCIAPSPTTMPKPPCHPAHNIHACWCCFVVHDIAPCRAHCVPLHPRILSAKAKEVVRPEVNAVVFLSIYPPHVLLVLHIPLPGRVQVIPSSVECLRSKMQV